MFASGKTAAVASAANYIEDVFSTYLYTGTGATQTITNGIDLSTKGGLVWLKDRPATGGAGDHKSKDAYPVGKRVPIHDPCKHRYQSGSGGRPVGI